MSATMTGRSLRGRVTATAAPDSDALIACHSKPPDRALAGERKTFTEAECMAASGSQGEA